MADNTRIEWTDATWSPLRVRVRQDAAEIARRKGYTSLVQIGEKMAGRVGQHCEHVSPECEHCYAESHNGRCLPGGGTGLPYDRRSRDLVEAFVDEKKLLQPLRWKRGRKIFVCNQTDLFADWYTDEQIDRVFAVMALAHWHTHQVLTKQPERALEWAQSIDNNEGGRLDGAGYRNSLIEGEAQNIYSMLHPAADPSEWLAVHQPLPNVWLGVTAGTRKSWAERVDTLRAIPATVRFVSVEPLLEDLGEVDLTGIDWVIAGGESGRGARPVHPDWFRSLRDQCVEAGVAFHFKQWGEWAPAKIEHGFHRVLVPTPQIYNADWEMARVGKHRAGRLLDGRTWDEFPGGSNA